MPTHSHDWTVPIGRSAVWLAHALEDGSSATPDVSFVDPLLRRRLSLLAKMTLKVAHDCAHDIVGVRLVYASRHGELGRTTAMLGDLAQNQELSPTAFSLSVLNASAGLFSILQHNTVPATAVSACAASFGYGLLEACQQLADQPKQPVLLVYADEPPPDVYGEVELSRHPAHAVALLLQSDAPRKITCRVSTDDAIPSAEAQSSAFIRCLETGQACWQGDGTRWTWSSHQQ